MADKSVTLSTSEFMLSAGEGEIKQQEEVSTIEHLTSLGWSIRQISRELGISRGTVRKYLRNGGIVAFRQPERKGVLSDEEEWLRRKFFQHDGNADVIRQELAKEKEITVSLRTVERAVKEYRDELRRASVATVRFETPPGKQMQADFGEKFVSIGGQRVKVHLFVAKQGYSRRIFVMAFAHENQASWFIGLEEAFRHFGGVPREVLADNPTSLVTRHNRATGEFLLNEKFKSFARYWGFVPRAHAPRRPQTKGKVESGVGYGKNNCLAGREFESWEALESHLQARMREVSDERVLSDRFDTPKSRYESAERHTLSPVADRAAFVQIREYVRKVSRDSFVDVGTNRYSVPWQHIGKDVRVHIADGEIVVHLHSGEEIARHAVCGERHRRIVTAAHLAGIVSCGRKEGRLQGEALHVFANDGLTRSLDEYENAVAI